MCIRDRVTDAEIDSLKEAVGSPKKHIAFTFGRFNPPTIGHEKLINKVASVGANDYLIVPSGSNDPKKNPLKVDDKIRVGKLTNFTYWDLLDADDTLLIGNRAR